MQLSNTLNLAQSLLELQESLQESKQSVVERQFSRELLRAKRLGLVTGRSRRISILLANELGKVKITPIPRTVSHKKLRTEEQQCVTGFCTLADDIVSLKLDSESDPATSRRRNRGISCFFVKAPDSSSHLPEADTNQ